MLGKSKLRERLKHFACPWQAFAKLALATLACITLWLGMCQELAVGQVMGSSAPSGYQWVTENRKIPQTIYCPVVQYEWQSTNTGSLISFQPQRASGYVPKWQWYPKTIELDTPVTYLKFVGSGSPVVPDSSSQKNAMAGPVESSLNFPPSTLATLRANPMRQAAEQDNQQRTTAQASNYATRPIDPWRIASFSAPTPGVYPRNNTVPINQTSILPESRNGSGWSTPSQSVGPSSLLNRQGPLLGNSILPPSNNGSVRPYGGSVLPPDMILPQTASNPGSSRSRDTLQSGLPVSVLR